MSQAGTPPEGPLRSLPLDEAIKETYQAVISNFGAAARLAALPAFLLFAFWQAALSGMGPEDKLSAQEAVGFLLPLTFLSLIPVSLFGFSWLRLLLLGPEEAQGFWPREPRLVMRFFVTLVQYFFLLAGFLFLTIFAFSAVTALIGGGATAQSLIFVYFFLALAMLWMLLRLSFALAARAVGEEYSFKNSWEQTRGQSGRLILAGLACLLPVQIASQFIALSLPEGFIVLAFLSYLNFLPFAFFFALVAVIFRKISGWVPQA